MLQVRHSPRAQEGDGTLGPDAYRHGWEKQASDGQDTWRASRPKGPTGIRGLDEITEGGLPNEAILRAELRRPFRWLKLKGVNATAAQDAPGCPRTSDHAQPRPMDRPRHGVDGRETGEGNSASYLARKGSFARASSQGFAQKAEGGNMKKSPANTGETQHSRGFSSPRPAGIEPTTYGLEDRCSIH